MLAHTLRFNEAKLRQVQRRNPVTFLTRPAHFILDNFKICQMKPQGGSIVPYGSGKLRRGRFFPIFFFFLQLCSAVYIFPNSFPITHVNMIRNYSQTLFLQNWDDSCMKVFQWHDESLRPSWTPCGMKLLFKKKKKWTVETGGLVLLFIQR